MCGLYSCYILTGIIPVQPVLLAELRKCSQLGGFHFQTKFFALGAVEKNAGFIGIHMDAITFLP